MERLNFAKFIKKFICLMVILGGYLVWFSPLMWNQNMSFTLDELFVEAVKLTSPITLLFIAMCIMLVIFIFFSINSLIFLGNKRYDSLHDLYASQAAALFVLSLICIFQVPVLFETKFRAMIYSLLFIFILIVFLQFFATNLYYSNKATREYASIDAYVGILSMIAILPLCMPFSDLTGMYGVTGLGLLIFGGEVLANGVLERFLVSNEILLSFFTFSVLFNIVVSTADLFLRFFDVGSNSKYQLIMRLINVFRSALTLVVGILLLLCVGNMLTGMTFFLIIALTMFVLSVCDLFPKKNKALNKQSKAMKNISVTNNGVFAKDTRSAVRRVSSVYKPSIERILTTMAMPTNSLISFANLINSGKHIILTGVPGTGKTTLAELFCIEAAKCNYVDGYTIVTATSDWSTFDTIGGYAPNDEGALVFKEGAFLKSIRENKWLIIDEINRAEVDKAFGHFFTILSNKNVELQYVVLNSRNAEQYIKLVHSEALDSYYDELTATYYIGRNWRIVASMNSYDKNSLFALSYAFMRRFAFVEIMAPTHAYYDKLINDRLKLSDKTRTAQTLLYLTDITPKKLGAAIILDIIRYVNANGASFMIDGICSLLIPQYEGLTMTQIKKLISDMATILLPNDFEYFIESLSSFYDIEKTQLTKHLNEAKAGA